MTQLKKAKSYFSYLLAIFISAVFAFIGKTAPTWAQNLKSERNAKVFAETFRVAQSDIKNVDGRLQVTNPTLDNRTQTTNPTLDNRTQTTNPTLDERTQTTNPTLGERVQVTNPTEGIANRLQVTSPVQIEAETLNQLNFIYVSTMNMINAKIINNPQDLTIEDLALIRANANAIEIEALKAKIEDER